MLTVDTLLFLTVLFIVNCIVSETLLMYGGTFFDESQNSQQAYQSGLNPYKDGYVNSDVYDKKKGYEKYMNSVQTGHAKNIEKK